MRNEDVLLSEVKAALKDAGLEVNVRIFKRKRLASDIRVTNKRLKGWDDKDGFFTPEEIEKLLTIFEKFDLREAGGYGLDHKCGKNFPTYRDFNRWDWANRGSVHWWIYA